MEARKLSAVSADLNPIENIRGSCFGCFMLMDDNTITSKVCEQHIKKSGSLCLCSAVRIICQNVASPLPSLMEIRLRTICCQ